MNKDILIKVDKETFFNTIYFFKLNVYPFPYTVVNTRYTIFNGEDIGMVEEVLPEGQEWPYVNEYYLTKYWAGRSNEVPKDFDLKKEYVYKRHG